jgi:hypothetical protein
VSDPVKCWEAVTVQHISDVIDHAIKRLEAGEPLEAVLAAYPLHSAELSSLLAAAGEVSLLRDVPAPAGGEAGLAAFLGEAHALRADRASADSRWRGTGWFAALKRACLLHPLHGGRWAQAAFSAMSILFLMFGLLGGTVVLADGSLPGDPLYPAKLTGEEVHLALTVQQSSRLEYHLSRMSSRVDELCRLVLAGRPAHEATVLRMNSSLQASLLIAATAHLDETARFLVLIERTVSWQVSRLSALEESVTTDGSPAEWASRPLLERARRDLSAAQSLARLGQADVHAFRLNASPQMLQFDAALATFPTSTPLTMPTASTQPSKTVPVQPALSATRTPGSTVMPAATATATAIEALLPAAAPTSTPVPTMTPTATRTSAPTATPTMTLTATLEPTVGLASTATLEPTSTRQPEDSEKKPRPTQKPKPTQKPTDSNSSSKK